jgi:manganese oxidase
MKRLIGSESRFLISTAFIFLILTTLNSCSKSTAYDNPGSGTGTKGGPGTNEVWIQSMSFTPSAITVTAGTTIKWTNKVSTNHTVTSDSGSIETFDSGSMGNGDTFSWQFNTPGTITYNCTFHPGMTASVIVK